MKHIQSENNAENQEQTQEKQSGFQGFKASCASRYHAAREWSRVHARRWSCMLHDAFHDRRAMNPVGFLAVAAVLGVTVTLGTLYSTSYAVTVDGHKVGVVADQEMVTQAISNVEEEGSNLLGYSYKVPGDVDYKFQMSLKSDLSQEKDIETYFYDQLGELTDQLRKYLVRVDGKSLGIVEDQDEFYKMLDELKNQYVTPNTTSAEFNETVTLDYIYNDCQLNTIPEMKMILQSSIIDDSTYKVQQGDTFNGIAYNNNMSVSELQKLNPGLDINRIQIGDVITVKALVPALTVRTLDHETYSESIPCPVETRQDSGLYKGETKIVSDGVEGESQVEANVVYINGQEQSREILSKKTVRQPTPTVKAVGTKERPKTASTGNFSWPTRGKITSYFGSRYIFGRHSFHSGIDIKANYGAPIKAADGGKVTFAGYKGSYGNLVIITHDNGMQTYYGHNSSLVVSAGQKVAKGQVIAKAGSTGRSTGNHCHFEVRVNGTAVNPLSYLP